MIVFLLWCLRRCDLKGRYEHSFMFEVAEGEEWFLMLPHSVRCCRTNSWTHLTVGARLLENSERFGKRRQRGGKKEKVSLFVLAESCRYMKSAAVDSNRFSDLLQLIESVWVRRFCEK